MPLSVLSSPSDRIREACSTVGQPAVARIRMVPSGLAGPRSRFWQDFGRAAELAVETPVT